jgi:acetyltransferase EpsM
LTAAEPLLILGTRTFAVEVADLASESGFAVAGFVENMSPERCSETLDGFPIHWIEAVGRLAETHRAVCGLGTTLRSRFADQAAEEGLRFASVLHPSARLARTSSHGEGAVVSVAVVVAAHTRIGRHVLINRGSLVGHHTTIGDYVSIQSGANIAGSCTIGDATYIGMGAVVLDHITIGSHSIVGAGAVVTRDVPDNVEVVGVPARITKTGIEGR